MKRFTETLKWQDSWFNELPAEMMLAWLYLVDTCDAAGVSDAPGRVTNAILPLPVDWDEFRKLAGKRIKTLDCGKWWLPRFVEYQYKGGVSSTSKQHGPIRDSIKKHSLPIQYLSNTYSIPNREVSNTSQEKEKEKEKEKETDKDKETEPLKLDDSPKTKPDTPRARFGAIFNRREATKWSGKELKALRDVGNPDPEDLALIERFYAAPEKEGTPLFRRKTLLTFLSNFPGEIDRARMWSESNGNAPKKRNLDPLMR